MTGISQMTARFLYKLVHISLSWWILILFDIDDNNYHYGDDYYDDYDGDYDEDYGADYDGDYDGGYDDDADDDADTDDHDD